MDGRSYALITGRRIVALVALALGVVYVIYAWREFGFGRWHRPGAAIFPVAVGIMVAIASVSVLLERTETPDGVRGTTFTLPGGDDLRRLAAVLVAFAIYFVAMGFVGHLIASALFLFVAMSVLSDKSKVRLAVYAVAIAILFEVLFVRLLQVQMPYGLTRLF